VLVSNQAGVGRGYYNWDGFADVQAEIDRQLARADAHLDGIFACAYHQDALDPFRVIQHPWRKPQPGMLLEAAQQLSIDLAGSIMIGDQIGDLQAARAAGLPDAILVRTGHGTSSLASNAAAFDDLRSLMRIAVEPDAATAIGRWLGLD
jgi:D-glycero-D-manno-heptose 1,7-bisphosphate phosphatase